MKTKAPNGAIAAPNSKREVWEALCRDQEVLERLKVTPEELEALRTCALLGSLTGSGSGARPASSLRPKSFDWSFGTLRIPSTVEGLTLSSTVEGRVA